jgi:AcrR family transcriptional regulator
VGIQERRQREREARRKLVLAATRQLIREHGIAGATTKRIAQRCELSEATLFWYFKNKDEIFTSLLLEAASFMTTELDALAARKLQPKRRLAELWKFFGRVAAEHPEYFYVFASVANPHSMVNIRDEIKDEIAQCTGDNFRRFASILEDCGVSGNPRLTADVLWGSFAGLVMLRESRRNMGAKPHPSDRELKLAFKAIVAGVAPELAGD